MSEQTQPEAQAQPEGVKGGIYYYNEATGHEIMQYFPEVERYKLQVGKVIKSSVQGYGHFYYRIVNIEDNYITKVFLKRIYLHYSDFIKLIIIIVLARIVFKWYIDFLM